MTCYGNDVSAISEGTFAIWGYGPKSGITDEGQTIEVVVIDLRDTQTGRISPFSVYVALSLLLLHSDVMAPAQPESPSLGPALAACASKNCQLSPVRWPRPGLAWLWLKPRLFIRGRWPLVSSSCRDPTEVEMESARVQEGDPLLLASKWRHARVQEGDRH